MTSNLNKAHVTRDSINAATWGINLQHAMK